MFPSTLSSFSRPNPTDRLNNPSHSALHNTVSSALGQVEAVIGVDGISSVVGTMMYDIRSPASKGGGHVQGAAFGGTGQTTFNKGDILVASSASILTKLAVGADNSVPIADSTAATGIRWAGFSGAVTSAQINVFTSSSVAGWTKPSLLSYVIVEVIGGGGGGGGTTNGNTGCGGGGGGGYSRKKIAASSLLASETIVIGAAGTAGAASGGAGGGGGTTGFGVPSILYATGGDGGSAAGGTSPGGLSGIGIGGDFNSQGNPGSYGFVGDKGAVANALSVGGDGGGTTFGGGGKGGLNDTSGTGVPSAGVAFGGGGGGSSTGSSGSDSAGATGFKGVCIVTDYYI